MNIVNLILVVITFAGSYLIYPYLPTKIPMHWNIRGQIDSYWPKDQAIWFMPALLLVIWILFQVLPQFDPKREKYKLFEKEWQIIQTAIVGFFTYINFVVLYLSVHPEGKVMPFMFAGIGVLFILLGNYLSKIRQNYFIGIRLPWTLNSEENWNKTHRFASWCFVILGIVTLFEAFVIWYAPVVIFGSVILAVILPSLYSFLLFKKKEHLMKRIILILFIELPQ